MNAILAGKIDYDCDPVLGPLPHVRAGTVKALAIAAKKRSPLLPNVPTSYEQGFPQFDCAPFYAVFAPKGTPKPVIDKLAAALSEGLDEPAVQKRLSDLGAEIAEPDRRTKSPGRTGAQRNRAANANPESRNCQMIPLICPAGTEIRRSPQLNRTLALARHRRTDNRKWISCD